jgi:hypothetical protein
MHRLNHKPLHVVMMMLVSFTAFMIVEAMATHRAAQEKTSPLVVRVAVFSNDQGRLDEYRAFIQGHLFPTLRTVPGYVGTFLGRDANSGQLISLSFWRNETNAVAGEEAVGRAIRGLPPGSAPRPSKVEKYIVEHSDLNEPFLR